MNLQEHLALSYYNEIGEINAEHKIFIVQHRETKRIYTKKLLDIYNLDVYLYLKNHPLHGIPQIYEVIEDDQQLIIIEEYVSGDTLDSILSNNGPIEENIIIKYALQLCDILKKLHSCNPPIIHRDIKPSNIIITPEDNVVLLDLNAAKYMKPQTEEDTRLLGTKGYAAPEQYGFGSSSTKTDIYALGMVMNTMLIGSFSNSTGKGSLSDIIKKCTELTPENRYRSINELENELSKLNVINDSDTKSTDSTTPLCWMAYLPPGFRSKNIIHMLVAIPLYAMMFWLSISLEVKDASAKQLFIERISCLVIFLSTVACICNYLDIYRIIPYGKSKNIFVKGLAVTLFTIAVVFAEFILMIFLSSIAS